MDEDDFLQLQEIIAEEFNVSATSITRSTTAEDVDGWDSISHAGLLIKIENSFQITFPDDSMFDLKDVGALHDQIVRLDSDKRSQPGTDAARADDAGRFPTEG
jgi:acyl carrier protein